MSALRSGGYVSILPQAPFRAPPIARPPHQIRTDRCRHSRKFALKQTEGRIPAHDITHHATTRGQRFKACMAVALLVLIGIIATPFAAYPLLPIPGYMT